MGTVVSQLLWLWYVNNYSVSHSWPTASWERSSHSCSGSGMLTTAVYLPSNGLMGTVVSQLLWLWYVNNYSVSPSWPTASWERSSHSCSGSGMLTTAVYLPSNGLMGTVVSQLLWLWYVNNYSVSHSWPTASWERSSHSCSGSGMLTTAVYLPSNGLMGTVVSQLLWHVNNYSVSPSWRTASWERSSHSCSGSGMLTTTVYLTPGQRPHGNGRLTATMALVC